jgi:membrane protein required for colicin V production
MLFGVLRGAVVIAALVLLAQFARLDEAKWWKRSVLLPYATECAGWIEAFAETGMRMLEQQASTPHSTVPALASARS